MKFSFSNGPVLFFLLPCPMSYGPLEWKLVSFIIGNNHCAFKSSWPNDPLSQVYLQSGVSWKQSAVTSYVGMADISLHLTLCDIMSVQKGFYRAGCDAVLLYLNAIWSPMVNVMSVGSLSKSPNEKPSLFLIGGTALRNNKSLWAHYFSDEQIGHWLLLSDCRWSKCPW